MRIALLIYGSLNTISGGYLYDRQLVRHWRTAGDTVEIISLPWRSYGQHLRDNWSVSLRDQLLNVPFDMIVQDELNHPSLAWLNSRLPAGRPPLVSIVHHLRSSEQHSAALMPVYQAIERRYLRSVDGFIFNSKTTREAVADLSGRTPRGVVVYPAADHLHSRLDRDAIAARAAGHPLQILFTGNVIPRKGLHTLIDAVTLLEDVNWRLRIIGNDGVDPGYTRIIRDSIDHRGLGDRITWLGTVADETLVGLLRESHVLAIPSSYEGFGIAYLEGMAHGLPAIASTSGAAAEMIEDGVNGFLIAPGDSATLASRLRQLHRDRSRLVAMGLAAQATYVDHPTWAQSAERAREFLLELAKEERVVS